MRLRLLYERIRYPEKLFFTDLTSGETCRLRRKRLWRRGRPIISDGRKEWVRA